MIFFQTRIKTRFQCENLMWLCSFCSKSRSKKQIHVRTELTPSISVFLHKEDISVPHIFKTHAYENTVFNMLLWHISDYLGHKLGKLRLKLSIFYSNILNKG